MYPLALCKITRDCSSALRASSARKGLGRLDEVGQWRHTNSVGMMSLMMCNFLPSKEESYRLFYRTHDAFPSDIIFQELIYDFLLYSQDYFQRLRPMLPVECLRNVRPHQDLHSLLRNEYLTLRVTNLLILCISVSSFIECPINFAETIILEPFIIILLSGKSQSFLDAKAM